MRDLKISAEDSLLATAGSDRPGAETPGAPAARRRPYESPELIEWGSLTQLTAGGEGVDFDVDNGATKAT